MQRNQETPVEGLIELGQASVETRGSLAEPYPEHIGTSVFPPMIED